MKGEMILKILFNICFIAFVGMGGFLIGAGVFSYLPVGFILQCLVTLVLAIIWGILLGKAHQHITHEEV